MNIFKSVLTKGYLHTSWLMIKVTVFSQFTTFRFTRNWRTGCGIHTNLSRKRLVWRERGARRRAYSIELESIDQNVRLQLPAFTECRHLPNNREEIKTQEIPKNYNHLLDIAQNIPHLDDSAQIISFFGRDAIQAHHVLHQRIGPANTPYA